MTQIVSDRSRIETAEHCLRKRYLQYHWQGVGLERTSLNLDLSVGITTHAILADVLDMLKRHLFTERLVHEAIAQHLSSWEQDIRVRGVAFEMASGYEQQEDGTITMQAPSIDFTVQLYSCWIRNSVTAWCSLRAPLFVQQYEVVDIEHEEELPLADGQLLFLARYDALLRRHSDGELFILNFKTVGEPNQWWQEQWPHDMQTLSEVLPVEARLGRRVSGVLIEGLVKGSKKVQYPRDSGQWWLNSPFCWVWTKDAAPPFPAEYAAKYAWTDPETGFERRLGKGYRRAPVWEVLQPREWLQWLCEHEPDLVGQQFVQLPAILRQDSEVASWQTQVEAREMLIAANATLANTSSGMLDIYFPQSTSGGHCLRPSKCSMYDICWGIAGIAPLESGYQLRVPNHPQEAEILNIQPAAEAAAEGE